MRKQQLLLALAVAAFAIPPLPAHGATQEEPVRHRLQEPQQPRVKQRAQKKPPKRSLAGTRAKTVPKTVPKAAPKAAPKARAKAIPRIGSRASPKAGPTTGPALAKASTDTESSITKAGDHDFAIQHGGMTRTYRVHVPASYNRAEPAPLLVALHGSGRNMDLQANDSAYGLIGKSEREGFIVVFPSASSQPGDGKAATWNAGPGGSEPGVDDVGFIRQVVTNVFRQMSVDRSRIYATGISSGGTMVYRLACEMPEVFRAVAPVAAADPTAGCTPAKPVSVLHIHAKNDSNTPFAGADLAATDKPRPPDLASVPRTVARWAQLDGCTATPRRILDKAGAYCEAYSWCRGQSEVRLCVTDSGGHTWPGGRAPQGGPAPSVAISATEMMWDFFSRH